MCLCLINCLLVCAVLSNRVAEVGTALGRAGLRVEALESNVQQLGAVLTNMLAYFHTSILTYCYDINMPRLTYYGYIY